MNDPSTPPVVEWFFRLVAALLLMSLNAMCLRRQRGKTP